MISFTSLLELVDDLRCKISPNLELVNLPFRIAYQSSEADCPRVAASIFCTTSRGSFMASKYLQQSASVGIKYFDGAVEDIVA